MSDRHLRKVVALLDYGIQINNFASGALYGYNLGIREHLETKKGILSNSLFLDFLKDNGLNIYKDKATRDVICIEFTFGSRSYEEELSRLENSKIEWRDSLDKGRISEEMYNQKIQRIDEIIEKCISQKDLYVKKSKEDIRIEWYTKGVSIEYRERNKSGKVIKKERIHYKMLWRTPGKAKKGSCMFIRDELYEVAHNFLYMGIQLPEHNTPIVEIGAYCALITSAVIDKIQIKPEEILVAKDEESIFCTQAISIETDENKHLVAKHMSKCVLTNIMFDGQALIDTSIFPEWANGYILLRHHMCKMAAFHTNIQEFFKDYYGKDYENAELTDMYGHTHKVTDIKLITTENAMKWKTFGVSYDYWLEWISKNDYCFGIVKTAHESKFGEIQQMSYQMVNALDIDIMDEVLDCSQRYILKLKNNDEFFLQYLESKKNFSNDFEVLLALCKHNKDFINTDYCIRRRFDIIRSIIMQLCIGKVLQEGDNLVLVGSPYAMLLHSVGEDVENDPTFEEEEGTIQCYSERFEFGEYLAGFRSPFNSKNNLDYLHNVNAYEFHKYFNLGKQVIAVNVLHTDFEDRNNGSDFDSDSLFVTNHRAIVEHAKKCYLSYPTIVNNIPKEKNIYDNTLKNYAIIDNTLASYQRAIGESSNLAQVAQTYSYNDFSSDKLKKYAEYVCSNEELDDYACILAVVAQIAIDSAKRKFDVDVLEEINRIRSELGVQEIGYPLFYADVQNKKLVGVNMRNKYKEPKRFGVKNKNTDTNKEKEKENEESKEGEEQEKKDEKEKVNINLVCPMNCVRRVSGIGIDKRKKTNSDGKTINVRKENNAVVVPFTDLLVPHGIKDNDRRRKSRKVEKMIERYGLKVRSLNSVEEEYDEGESWLVCQEEFDNLIQDIKEAKLSHNYAGLIYWLICRSFITNNVKHAKFQTQLDKNRPTLLRVLYEVNPKAFLECFIKTE